MSTGAFKAAIQVISPLFSSSINDVPCSQCSFGVVLLELITGRLPVNLNAVDYLGQSLVEWVCLSLVKNSHSKRVIMRQIDLAGLATRL